MGHLAEVLLSLAFVYSVECVSKRGIVENSYGYPSYHTNNHPLYYPKVPVSSPLVHDASKPSQIVAYPPSAVSSYQVNQQFPTVGHPVEYTVQQYPHSNQYSVQQPFQVGNLYIPYNQFQQVTSNINSDFRKPVQVQKALSQPTNTAPQVFQQHQQLGPKVGAVKSVPLFHHQVYHPLHTSIHQPQNLQNPRLSPPTPPRIYKNFHPIIPSKPNPVSEAPIPEKMPQQQQEAEKEEVNDEEEEEENEQLQEEDEDHENVKEEEADEEEEEYFRPGKFFSGRFMVDDEDEDHGRYRHRQEADDDDDYRSESNKYSQSRPSKLSSKHKYPKHHDRYSYYKDKHFSKPLKTDPDFKNFREFKEPKMEFKMYKYSKSSKPQGREYIEGKGSENVPVAERNQKSYKKQWIISSKTSSMTDE